MKSENPVLMSTDLPLPLFIRGKVRDTYDLGNQLLIVATDRISAFDVVMSEPIPGKGETLTRMALFWFAKLAHVVPNHLTGEEPESVVAPDCILATNTSSLSVTTIASKLKSPQRFAGGDVARGAG